MFRRLIGRTYREPEDDREGGAGPTPAEINAAQNKARLDRINAISAGVDGSRADELDDVNGERATGRFQGGEFDDSPEARERRAELEEGEAEAALREAEERAALEEADETRARRLQAEGAEDEEEPGEGRASPASRGASDTPEAGDERVINGVKHYLTIVNGEERWLTLKQLRDTASKTASADLALQRANEALQRASQAALTPKEEPAEIADSDLENVVLSAMMGDTEAVKKLVSVIKPKPSGATPSDVSRLVSQQIATQRALESARAAQRDLVEHEVLGSIFDQRLHALARETPNMTIEEAHKAVAAKMRKEFAPMLGPRRQSEISKAERKRQIVNPPQVAARQTARQDDDQELSVSSVIDQMARGRGQDRAIRSSRRS